MSKDSMTTTNYQPRRALAGHSGDDAFLLPAAIPERVGERRAARRLGRLG